MATYTLAELRTRVREEGEYYGPKFPDATINRFINSGISDLYELLISADASTYAKEAEIELTDGYYSLPSDYYLLLGVDQGTTPLSPFVFGNRGSEGWGLEASTFQQTGTKVFVRPAISGSIKVHYIPTAPQLTSDSATFDGLNCWVEFVVLTACIKCAGSEDTDPTQFLQERARQEELIRRRSTRNIGSPPTVQDVSGRWRRWRYW